MMKIRLLPGFLGGGRRQFATMLAQGEYAYLERIGRWIEEGTVKAVIDQWFPFEQAPRAFEKLKMGRTKGKIVIHQITWERKK